MRLLFCFLVCFSSLIANDREDLLNLAGGEWVAKSLHAAAELDIATHLAEGPKSIEQLAALTQCNQQSLYRLLRLLSSVGVFSEGEGKSFSNTSKSALLASSNPESLRSLIAFYGREMSSSWSAFPESLQTGKTAFEIAFKKPVFQYFQDHPEVAAQFNAAMKEKSKVVIEACLNVFDFSDFSHVVDVGGGLGYFLKEIANSYPSIEGILFDLPAVAQAANHLGALPERCRVIPGDFFQSVPQGGDAYVLKSILHDWSDQDAVRILQNCYAAMKEGAKLILVEPVVGDSNKKEYAKLMDVYMMAITGGRERTEREFALLLDQAGFAIESITPTDTEFSLIEASLIKKEVLQQAIGENAQEQQAHLQAPSPKKPEQRFRGGGGRKRQQQRKQS